MKTTMKTTTLMISLVLNVLLATGLIAGLTYTRKTLRSMESLCAEAEAAKLRGYVAVLESDRADKCKYVTNLMRNVIKDDENGWPSVKAPSWTEW